VTQDPTLYLTLAVSGLAGIAMITTAGLSGWRGWLALKRQELDAHHGPEVATAMPTAACPVRAHGSRSRT
jgi:hypothetical protein